MTFIIGIIIGGGLVVFALQNLAPVMVTFFGWNIQGSIAIIVLIAFLAGGLLTLLFSLSAAFTGMINESRLKKHNAKLQKELDDHKQALSEAELKLAAKPDTVIITDTQSDILS
jgi:uncharacterized integral membrane protein